MSDARKALRLQLREQRRNLDPVRQRQNASLIALRLWRHPWVRNARTIGAYWPADGEVNPLPFMQQAHRRGRQVFLPVIDIQQRTLSFQAWQPCQTMRLNCFGIPEPPTRSAACELDELDVLLMPLVGFDARGHRLGMGGGFYDRTLADAEKRPGRLIGLAHSLQEVNQLAVAPWDRNMEAIVTEKKVFWTGR